MKPNLSLSELLGWDGASPLRADLHCHSTISDGSFTSAELLAQAQAAGLTHLAITNHDTTAGLDVYKRQDTAWSWEKITTKHSTWQ